MGPLRTRIAGYFAALLAVSFRQRVDLCVDLTRQWFNLSLHLMRTFLCFVHLNLRVLRAGEG